MIDGPWTVSVKCLYKSNLSDAAPILLHVEKLFSIKRSITYDPPTSTLKH